MTDQDLSHSKTTAEKVTQPTNPQWEQLLRGAFQRCQPKAFQAMEAAGTLDGYLTGMVATALTQEQDMIEAGMTPEAARELALSDLLEQDEEQTTPETAEEDEDDEEMAEEMGNWLLGN